VNVLAEEQLGLQRNGAESKSVFSFESFTQVKSSIVSPRHGCGEINSEDDAQNNICMNRSFENSRFDLNESELEQLRNENVQLKDQLNELKESLDLITNHAYSSNNYYESGDSYESPSENINKRDVLSVFITNEKILKEEIFSLHEELNNVKFLLDQTQNLRKIEQDTMQKFKDQLKIYDV
jgi:hypothetical protein